MRCVLLIYTIYCSLWQKKWATPVLGWFATDFRPIFPLLEFIAIFNQAELLTQMTYNAMNLHAMHRPLSTWLCLWTCRLSYPLCIGGTPPSPPAKWHRMQYNYMPFIDLSPRDCAFEHKTLIHRSVCSSLYCRLQFMSTWRNQTHISILLSSPITTLVIQSMPEWDTTPLLPVTKYWLMLAVTRIGVMLRVLSLVWSYRLDVFPDEEFVVISHLRYCSIVIWMNFWLKCWHKL